MLILIHTWELELNCILNYDLHLIMFWQHLGVQKNAKQSNANPQLSAGSEKAVILDLFERLHAQDLLWDTAILMYPVYEGIEPLKILLRPDVTANHKPQLLICSTVSAVQDATS